MNKTVCVITGGGSGMGLAAAKEMPRDKILVLSGRTVKKLEKAVAELEALGFEAHACACDTSVREDVRRLAEYAASLGEIRNVIHAAGLSPAMAKPEQLLRVNAAWARRRSWVTPWPHWPMNGTAISPAWTYCVTAGPALGFWTEKCYRI